MSADEMADEVNQQWLAEDEAAAAHDQAISGRTPRGLTEVEEAALRDGLPDGRGKPVIVTGNARDIIETPPTVQELFVRVMRGVEAIAKTGRNKAQNYEFRGVDATMNAVGPLVREHGLIVLPHATVIVADERYETRRADGTPGTPMRSVTLKVIWKFVGPVGDNMYAETLGEAADASDKAVPKAMSVAFRELWLKGLVVPTGDKDVDQEPAPPRAAEVITPTGLFEQLADGLLRAASEDPGVKAAWAVVQSHYDAHQLSRADYTRLRDVATGRIKELRAVEGTPREESRE